MAKLRHNTQIATGFTLIEMLVAVTVFTILAVVTTQILALSLRSVTKSQNIAETRENIDNAVLTIDRLLRTATSCTDGPTEPFEYQDQYHNNVTLTCEEDDGIGYIGSNSARITSKDVDINCDPTVTYITCVNEEGKPAIVNISITGEDSSHGISEEGAIYTSTSRTIIRNYSRD